MDQFLEDEYRAQRQEARTPWSWAWMNPIQKGGFIVAGVFLLAPFFFNISFVHSMAISLAPLYIGLVAGYSWRFRHIVNFWAILFLAITVQACLYQSHLSVINYLDSHHYRSRAFATPVVGMITIEIVASIFLFKRLATWKLNRSRAAKSGLAA